MAFREQHGFTLTYHDLWFLENHELCVGTDLVTIEAWRVCNRSFSRVMKRNGSEGSFKRGCKTWARRSRKWVPRDLVFIKMKDRSLSAYRMAFFRYRADITLILKEATVSKVMES